MLAAAGWCSRRTDGRTAAAKRDTARQGASRCRRVLVGAAGGLIVGLTSVGSGSLIIVVLLALYPKLRANDLVGTDLVQAIPLVTAAALGHAFFGDLKLDLAAAVLMGSVPGVLIGARLSSRAPARVVRVALVIVLLASALKLLGVASGLVIAVAAAVVALAAGHALWQRRPGRTAAPAMPAGSAQLIQKKDLTSSEASTSDTASRV